MWGLVAYRRHVQEFLKLNPVCRAGVTTWAMERVVEELDRVIKRPIIQCWSVAHESG